MWIFLLKKLGPKNQNTYAVCINIIFKPVRGNTYFFLICIIITFLLGGLPLTPILSPASPTQSHIDLEFYYIIPWINILCLCIYLFNQSNKLIIYNLASCGDVFLFANSRKY